MNTNKYSAAALTLVSIALSVVTVALLLVSVYATLLVHEYEEDLEQECRYSEQLETELSNTRTDLAELKDTLRYTVAELDSFVNPIQYRSAAGPTYDIPLSDELQEYTYEMCSYYELTDYYEVILAMMWKESAFDPNEISSTDDYGIMQINKCNHDCLKESLGLVDIMDVESNIEGGIYIMYTLLNRYEDIDKALMAYNMGPSAAAAQWKRGIYASAYSRDVLDKAALIASNNYS